MNVSISPLDATAALESLSGKIRSRARGPVSIRVEARERRMLNSAIVAWADAALTPRPLSRLVAVFDASATASWSSFSLSVDERAAMVADINEAIRHFHTLSLVQSTVVDEIVDAPATPDPAIPAQERRHSHPASNGGSCSEAPISVRVVSLDNGGALYLYLKGSIGIDMSARDAAMIASLIATLEDR